MSPLKRALALAGVAAVMFGTAAVVAPSASAAVNDGVCDSGEVCLYDGTGRSGSMRDVVNSWKNFGTGSGCATFVTGSKAGQCLKNQVGSVWNRTGKTVGVYYNSDYRGAGQKISANTAANLNSTLNNDNAGMHIGNLNRIAWQLYEAGGGSITAHFDGYVNTDGRHEGIDMAKGIGTPVHALAQGWVTRVTEGYTGRASLSTIAIYYSAIDKTVVYLHANPKDSLDAGDYVNSGDVIGYESWRGVSSSSSAHTHVEMRPGRQTSAAVSVGDWTLDNPDPTNFWVARGLREN
jgi:murein DD-endopeptidase MepM/ murein hydrolase activator NlpD